MPAHPLTAELHARVRRTLTAGLAALEQLDRDHMLDGNPEHDRSVLRLALDRTGDITDGGVYALDRAEDLCRVAGVEIGEVADEVADIVVAGMTLDDVYEQEGWAVESYGEMLAENGSSALYGLGYSAADAMSAAYQVTPRPEDSALYRALRRRIEASSEPQRAIPSTVAQPAGADDIPF